MAISSKCHSQFFSTPQLWPPARPRTVQAQASTPCVSCIIPASSLWVHLRSARPPSPLTPRPACQHDTIMLWKISFLLENPTPPWPTPQPWSTSVNKMLRYAWDVYANQPSSVELRDTTTGVSQLRSIMTVCVKPDPLSNLYHRTIGRYVTTRARQ